MLNLPAKYQLLKWVKKNLTVVGSQTLLKPNGLFCLPMELAPPIKKSITCSRSFEEPTENWQEAHNPVSYFLEAAVAKMRDHKLAACAVTVFVQINRFNPENYYGNSYTYKSTYPSDNLFELQYWAGNCFNKIFAARMPYKKRASF